MTVVILDARKGEFSDSAVADAEGGVLVIDHAESAAKNDELYQRLLGSPYVSAVICLAVDAGGPDHTTVVRPPPSLGPAEHGAVLWIGHEHGIRWRPTETVVRRVPVASPSSMCRLIDVLRQPAVFHAVVRAIGAMPYSTASPGTELVGIRLRTDELRRVQAEAVVQFTDPNAGRPEAWELPRAAFQAAAQDMVSVDRSEAVLVAEGNLASAQAAALSALAAAEECLQKLASPLASAQPDRPGRGAVRLVERARAATRTFHEQATDQIERIEDAVRHRATSEDRTTRLGVHRAAEARPELVRDHAREVVASWLGRYRSIGRFLPDLDSERQTLEPQGRRVGVARVRSVAPPDGPVPEFRTWPSVTLGLPIIAATGVLAALGVAPATVVALLAVGWLGAGVVLHAREPDESGEVGYLRAVKPAISGWLLPMAAGLVLAPFTSIAPPLPFGWRITLTLLAVLGLVGTVAFSWHRSVSAWQRDVDLARLRHVIETSAAELDRVLRTEWRPSARRALLSEGFRQASIGLAAVSDVLVGKSAELLTDAEPAAPAAPAASTPDRDVYLEIREVIVADLVDLTLAALMPCWEAVEAGRTSPPVDRVTERAEALLADYRDHVRNHGLLIAPPWARSDTTRERLAAGMWQASPVRGALVVRVDDEMTQLCHAGQLLALPAMAEGAGCVRFAPHAARGVPDLSGPVIWTGDSDVAGSVRLVPLKQGVFE